MRASVVVVVILGAACLASPVRAQSPSYGGGLMPGARGGPGTFTPTMGIVLQPRGGTIAVRFDTTVRCGSQIYSPAGRATVPFDGRSFSASKRRARLRLAGGKLTYSWTLRGEVDGTIASGSLRITGTRRLRGRRSNCSHKPNRTFSARITGAAPGGSPTPAARAAFGGLSDMQIGGLQTPVMLRVSRDGRKIGSRWTASAACGDGPPLRFINYSPPARLRADGSFSRPERYSVRFSDALLRYRISFTGRISGESVTGTLRARARVFSRDGRRLLTRCDTGARSWSAALLRPIAPAAVAPPPTALPVYGPGAGAVTTEPSVWSLQMTSDPGDFIGRGQTWSHGPPDNFEVTADRSSVTFKLATPDGGYWHGGFWPRVGEELRETTYTDDDTSGTATMGISGMGHGCTSSYSTFTVEDIRFDAQNVLRRFRVTFEYHCDHHEPALRGTLDFGSA